jgi:hypothetical protein
MEKIFKNYILGTIIIAIIASPSILMSETAFGTAKNPVDLPRGIWTLYAAGQKGYLDITSVTPDHQVEGTLTAVLQAPPFTKYTSKIFGFWDPDAWKIMFLKENELKPTPPGLSCNTINNITGEVCHHRDQIYTGYMFGGLPCTNPANQSDTGCTNPGNGINATEPITMAGSFEAFGGGSGTGATADRSVFGWVATHNGTIAKIPCTCDIPEPSVNQTQSPIPAQNDILEQTYLPE